MFINLVKKSFMDVVKNPIITLLLVLYFIIISMLGGAISIQRSAIMAYLLIFTSFLFIAIFIVGWLRVIKEIALKKPDEERKNSFIAMFFESVGENIVPGFMGMIIYIFFSIIFVAIAYFTSLKIFGNPQTLIPDIQNATNILDIANLPPEKLKILYGWQACFSGFACLFMMLFLYYFPAIIFDTKTNLFLKPFIALKNNFCFLFKNFLVAFLIFILLFSINTIVSVVKNLSMIFFQNYSHAEGILYVLYILYVIYFLSFSVMLICNHYGKNYSCDNGPDCIGEDIGNDSVSEED